MRITKKSVDTLRPEGRDRVYLDDTLKGFGLRVKPSGRKSYIVQYRVGGGRTGQQRRFSLGEHGKVTPEEARKRARRILADAAEGKDPAGDRQKEREAETIQTLGPAFLEWVEAYKKPATSRNYRHLWDRHVTPDRALFGLKVKDVNAEHVARLHRSLKATPYAANRVLALLSSFFTYAARFHRLRALHDNPARGVQKFREFPRQRRLTRAEVERLGAALEKAEREGLRPAPGMRNRPKSEATLKHRSMDWDRTYPANPDAVAAIRLIALTGCRCSEIVTLRWDAVDFERGMLVLADSKTGASARPIGGAALQLLAERMRGGETRLGSHVFPLLQGRGQPEAVKRLWYAVRHEAGVPDARLHDWRHLVGSLSADAHDSAFATAQLLGHRQVSTTHRYVHAADPVRRAADRISGDIAAWMAGSETTVSKLRKA